MQGSQNDRLRELAAQIAIEQDHDKFAALVEELNQLLDGDHPFEEPLNPNSSGKPSRQCEDTA